MKRKNVTIQAHEVEEIVRYLGAYKEELLGHTGSWSKDDDKRLRAKAKDIDTLIAKLQGSHG